MRVTKTPYKSRHLRENSEGLKTIREVVNEEGMSRQTLYTAIYAGKFKAKGVNGSYLIDTTRQAYKKWLASHKAYKENRHSDETMAKARAKKKVKVSDG